MNEQVKLTGLVAMERKRSKAWIELNERKVRGCRRQELCGAPFF
jgi:hypothetical protein